MGPGVAKALFPFVNVAGFLDASDHFARMRQNRDAERQAQAAAGPADGARGDASPAQGAPAQAQPTPAAAPASPAPQAPGGLLPFIEPFVFGLHQGC